jgi:CubicO group peptidase (beta-lactamase class C family)
MKRHILPLLLALFISCTLYAQKPAEDPAKAIDQYLSEIFKPNEPGATVLVIKDGKTVIRKGYGLANIESNTTNTPETIFRIGSVTKQFTSTAILKLAEQGKLSLQDDIKKYLPDYPTQKKVTIEHLLTHTSGIKSYTSLPDAMTTEAKAKEISVNGMINVFKDQPVDFNPGDSYLYNNSGYFLLGAIIEKVSGMPWGEYLKKNFFTPLKMTNTFCYDPKLTAQATGYQKTSANEFGVADYVHPTVPYSAGAIFSTVDDLWKWEKAIFDFKVVKKEWLEKAWTPLTLNNGKKESYGYGWQLGKIGEDKVIGHGGGIDGFVCFELYVPSTKLFVTILLNTNSAGNPENLAYEMAYKFSSQGSPATISLDEKTMDEYVGVYQISDKEDRIITRSGNQLHSQRTGSTKFDIDPYAKDAFFFKNSQSRLKFNRDAQGKIISAEMMGKEFVNQVATKTAKPIPADRATVDVPASVFDTYVGEYELAPGFIITVRREENKFMTQATGQPAFEIFAESETVFFLKVVDAKIEFKKNAEGKTESLILFQSGRSIPGKKIK